MTHAGAGKGLFSGILQTDLSSSYTSGEVCIKRFGQGILPVPESSTYIRLDNPDVPIAYSESLSTDTTNNMGYLCCCNNYNFSAFHVSEGGSLLDMTVLDNRGVVITLYLDKALFLDGLIKVSHLIGRTNDHVIWLLLVDSPRSRSHGRLNGEQRLVLFILYLDLPDCLMCRNFILRYDCGNIVAVEANPCIEQFPVCNILMLLDSGPGVPCCGELDVRNIKTGDDINDTRYLPGLFKVKGKDKPVCYGAVHDFCEKGVRAYQIASIFCLTRDFFFRINSVQGFSDYFHCFSPSSEKPIIHLVFILLLYKSFGYSRKGQPSSVADVLFISLIIQQIATYSRKKPKMYRLPQLFWRAQRW